MTYIYSFNHQIYGFVNSLLEPVLDLTNSNFIYCTKEDAKSALFEYMDILTKNSLCFPEATLRQQMTIADNIHIRPYNPALHIV